LSSSQSGGGGPVVQRPELHTSMPSHTFPLSQSESPLQGVHPGIGGCWQPSVGSQESTVQAFWSLQSGATPAVHFPCWQVSGPSHALPSLQEVPSGAFAC
jgi:hypothetical protein